jgi:DNA-binding CsgD family transcriptional regulator
VTLRARADLHIARYNDIRTGLATGAAAQRLAKRLDDPLERAAALNALANNLIVAGYYSQAFDVAQIQGRDADQYALDFVREHVATNRASAFVGMRRLDDAARALRSAPNLDLLSPWLNSNYRCIAARLAIAREDLDAAWAVIQQQPSEDLAAGMRGEHLAVAALVAAAKGMGASARALATEAELISSYVEVVVLVPLARALVSRTSNERRAHLEEAQREFLRTGAADALVTAYRAEPSLLAALGENRNFVGHLKEIVDRAEDAALAARTGAFRLPEGPEKRVLSVLTPREREVLALVRVGLRNREIAATLFISEVTVKAHLRHIYEKLGVRTRTQAALAADQDD